MDIFSLHRLFHCHTQPNKEPLNQDDFDAIQALIEDANTQQLGGFDPADVPVQDPAEGGEADEVGTLTRVLLDGTVRVDHIVVPAEEA